MKNIIEAQIASNRPSRKEQIEIKPEEQMELDLLALGKAEELIHTLLVKMKSKQLPEELQRIKPKEKKTIRQIEITFPMIQKILKKLESLYEAEKEDNQDNLHDIGILKVQINKASKTKLKPEESINEDWLLEIGDMLNELQNNLRLAIQEKRNEADTTLKKFPNKYKGEPRRRDRKKYNEATISF